MEGPGGMEDADLDDFMETVTTYKCKFCAFTATTTQEMGQHARSQHIVRRTIQAPGMAVQETKLCYLHHICGLFYMKKIV